MSNIQLAPNFKFPAIDYAGQGNAILGIRDSGKTYTAMKAAEQLLDASIPVIALDPVGIWKNLKIGIGKHKGYPIVVAGGEGADIRLTPDNAVDIVRAAMKANVSLVIDLYSRELINKSTWIKIVQEVVDLLMYENKEYGMRHIFLEEAAEFIPQRLQPQHARVYAAIERLARMGRNARLGLTIINQRAEEVNKAILEICAFSLLHKQVGKNSLKSIQTWLELLQIDNVQEIIKSLPTLKQGECWAIGHGGHPKRIQVAARNTYHPDPKKGVDHAVKMATVDVSGFVAKLNEQLKRPEMKVLVAKKGTPTVNTAHVEEIARLKKMLADKDRELKGYKDLHAEAVKALGSITSIAQRHVGSYIPTPTVAETPKTNTIITKTVSSETSINNDSVSTGPLKYLKAAAMFYPEAITKKRMCAMAGTSFRKSTHRAYMAYLKTNGLLEVIDSNTFKATEKGMNVAGDIDPLPSDPQGMINMWCSKLSPGPGIYLRKLADVYPNRIPKDRLAESAGTDYTKSTHRAYMAELNACGLIDVNGEGIKAADELFQ